MIFINNKFFIFIKALLLSLLIIGFLIFDGNIERIFIITLMLTLINILRSIKLEIKWGLLFLIGLGAGYVLGNTILYYSVIGINNNDYQNSNIKNEKKLTKPAVIIFSGGEPNEYETFNILKNIYKEEKIMNKAHGPIMASQYKLAYEKVGNSKYVDLCKRINENLSLRLGTDYDLYSAYFNIEPDIYEEVNILSRQYEKLILVPLMLSESKEYKKFKNTIDEGFLNSDTDIKIVPFLWNSQKLARQVSDKAMELVERKNIYSTGMILLISNDESFYEQSILSNEVLRKMAKSKFQEEKIICMKYNNDDLLLKSIKGLKLKGANNIIVISISSLHNGIREQNKINKLIRKIEKRDLIKIQHISGWGIGDDLLNELEYRIRITNLKN
jgi:hypothetical protein